MDEASRVLLPSRFGGSTLWLFLVRIRARCPLAALQFCLGTLAGTRVMSMIAMIVVMITILGSLVRMSSGSIVIIGIAVVVR